MQNSVGVYFSAIKDFVQVLWLNYSNMPITPEILKLAGLSSHVVGFPSFLLEDWLMYPVEGIERNNQLPSAPNMRTEEATFYSSQQIENKLPYTKATKGQPSKLNGTMYFLVWMFRKRSTKRIHQLRHVIWAHSEIWYD